MVHGGSHSYGKLDEQQERNLKSLVSVAGIVLAGFILLARMFYLQFFRYEENLRLSEQNRLRKIEIKAERGYIKDRNGEILVRNRPSFHVALLPYQLKDRDKVFQRLLRLQNDSGRALVDSADLDFVFQRGRWRQFKPLTIVEDANESTIAFIEERAELFPGIVTTVESRRDYPYGTLAAHLLGYTGEISKEQLQDSFYVSRGYQQGDRIGLKGLEKFYESYFRGHDGVKFAEVNAYGRQIGLIEDMQHLDAQPGHHLITTIDLGLQQVAENAFSDSLKGALVAIDPRNGEILAMVSSPRFDPNIFSLDKEGFKKGWAKVALDSTKPLNNRAIQGTYEPGSTFKFITAAAALEYNFMHPESKYPVPCTGGFRFGRRYQRCWKASGHGNVDMIDALRVSCDVYFYQCGLQVGMGPINELARRFGMGDTLGIDIPGEKRGLLMDSVTYNQRFKHKGWRWSRGLILNLAIGQGEAVTPLQIASYFGSMAIARGVYQPHLMKEIRSDDDSLIYRYKPRKIRSGHLREENRMALLQAMEEVVSAPGGTGHSAAVPGVRVGGKSGSAENPHGEKTHAWFVATAPLEAPEIAVVALMENAGHGGSVAGPAVGKVLRYYFMGDSTVAFSRRKKN